VLALAGPLEAIRRRLWVIAVITLVLAGAGLGISLVQTPVYEASIKILVGQEQQSTPSGNLGGDVQGLQQLTQTMAQGVMTRPVAEAVIDQLGLQVTPEDFLENHLSAEQISATQYVEVRYKDSNPERSQQVVNAVGNVFSQQVSDISPSANAITATVWERAAVPSNPVSPNLMLNLGLAVAVGLILGVGMALFLEYLDDSWRSPEEAEQVSGVPTFGVIPEHKIPENKRG
jgi:capsular polysaccharide biosynthesis protein